MDFGSIIGTIGNMLGGGKKTADGAQTGGLQDIIANLGLGDLSNINPQDIISKFQNGELSRPGSGCIEAACRHFGAGGQTGRIYLYAQEELRKNIILSLFSHTC